MKPGDAWYDQQRRQEQQRVQTQWDADRRRFREQHLQPSSHRQGGPRASGLGIAIQIVMFLVVVAAGVLLIVSQVQQP